MPSCSEKKLISENVQSDIDEKTNKNFNKQSEMKEELQILETQYQELKQERKQYPDPRIIFIV